MKSLLRLPAGLLPALLFVISGLGGLQSSWSGPLVMATLFGGPIYLFFWSYLHFCDSEGIASGIFSTITLTVGMCILNVFLGAAGCKFLGGKI